MDLITTQDWTKFRNLETLPQKAGVSRDKLGLLVAKELADNALDHCGHCEVGYVEPNGFYVKDQGQGINPELLPKLFSINRPFLSSKILRMPTRGALGNGLRVVSGAVIASGGSLCVSTRGQRYQIHFQADGTSTAKQVGDSPHTGTKIEIQFGDSLTPDLHWAELAILIIKAKSIRGEHLAIGTRQKHFMNYAKDMQVVYASWLQSLMVAQGRKLEKWQATIKTNWFNHFRLMKRNYCLVRFGITVNRSIDLVTVV
ncbi:ATP-binding protein [Paenibacillus sp. NRS-1783]|uniref:ATP-binding protein n=1 Tax=Paenibacillus sp. NRS-1783 TaxID=3233907 RepID=UPI003D2E99E0